MARESLGAQSSKAQLAATLRRLKQGDKGEGDFDAAALIVQARSLLEDPSSTRSDTQRASRLADLDHFQERYFPEAGSGQGDPEQESEHNGVEQGVGAAANAGAEELADIPPAAPTEAPTEAPKAPKAPVEAGELTEDDFVPVFDEVTMEMLRDKEGVLAKIEVPAGKHRDVVRFCEHLDPDTVVDIRERVQMVAESLSMKQARGELAGLQREVNKPNVGGLSKNALKKHREDLKGQIADKEPEAGRQSRDWMAEVRTTVRAKQDWSDERKSSFLQGANEYAFQKNWVENRRKWDKEDFDYSNGVVALILESEGVQPAIDAEITEATDLPAMQQIEQLARDLAEARRQLLGQRSSDEEKRDLRRLNELRSSIDAGVGNLQAYLRNLGSELLNYEELIAELQTDSDWSLVEGGEYSQSSIALKKTADLKKQRRDKRKQARQGRKAKVSTSTPEVTGEPTRSEIHEVVVTDIEPDPEEERAAMLAKMKAEADAAQDKLAAKATDGIKAVASEHGVDPAIAQKSIDEIEAAAERNKSMTRDTEGDVERVDLSRDDAIDVEEVDPSAVSVEPAGDEIEGAEIVRADSNGNSAELTRAVQEAAEAVDGRGTTEDTDEEPDEGQSVEPAVQEQTVNAPYESSMTRYANSLEEQLTTAEARANVAEAEARVAQGRVGELETEVAEATSRLEAAQSRETDAAKGLTKALDRIDSLRESDGKTAGLADTIKIALSSGDLSPQQLAQAASLVGEVADNLRENSKLDEEE